MSLGLPANVAWADDPGGADIEVPPPAPADPPAPAAADEDNVHLYLSGNLGGSFAKGRSSGRLTPPFSPTFPNSGNDQDEDIFGGGALGIHYDKSPVGLRFELEGHAARGLQLETRTGAPGGTLDTTLTSWTLFGNLWLDFPLTDSFSFFGGGGVGMAVTDLSSCGGGIACGRSSDDTTWAWQTGGGMSIAPIDWLAFDVSYRFIDMGEPDLQFHAGWPPSRLRMHLQSHDLVLGIRMNYFSF